MFDVLEPEDPRQVGRYRIVARVGAGGMGQVYLGRSPGGRPVAVKVVRPELARDGDFRRRFAREVAAARRVNGAFTAGVVDADPDGSPAWLATVYVSGVPLGDAVARHGPWPAGSVLALGAGLAEALEAIHAAGVVHRDLKPSNVLLASDGPRVIDFGISSASEASALTHTGMTIGTPGFMSPEQLTGRPVGPASDVFALGAVLAYTAVGIGPFGTGTPHALHFRAVYEQPDLDALPPGLREIVADCLAKEPDQRPTVADLLAPDDRPGPREPADATLSAHRARLDARRGRPARTGEGRRRAAPRPVAVPDRAGRPAAPPRRPRHPDRVPTPDGVPTLTPDPARGMHEAPTETADQAAQSSADTPEPPAGPAAGPAAEPLADAAAAPASAPADAPPGPAPSAHPRPDGTPPSRRNALLALTGTALAAATVVTGWKISEGGSGSAGPLTPDRPRPGGRSVPPRRPSSAAPASRSGPSAPAARCTRRRPWRTAWSTSAATTTTSTRWTPPRAGGAGPSTPATSATRQPAVADGVVYVGTDRQRPVRGGRRHRPQALGLPHRTAAAVRRRSWWTASSTSAATTNTCTRVDAVTGRSRWSFRCRKDGLVQSSPAVAGGAVYAASDDGYLYALDAATGRKRWAFAVGQSADWRPAVADGLVHVSDTDGHLYAVDAATGKQRWRITGPRHKVAGAGYRAFSSPTVAGGVVYVGDDIEYLYALDAATGRKGWTFTTGGSVFRPRPWRAR